MISIYCCYLFSGVNFSGKYLRERLACTFENNFPKTSSVSSSDRIYCVCYGESIYMRIQVLVITLFCLSLGACKSEAALDASYERMEACEKQEQLWQEVEASEYKELPTFSNLGIIQFLAMSFQELKLKTDYKSDIAPKGWKKYLHRKGAMAKVKIVPVGKKKFTGIFEGADCALLRLSLTYNPKGGKPVAPGLALKVLRSRVPSANVSALYRLDGQDKDFNFFKNPLSNIVPVGDSIGTKMVNKLFKRVTSYPEELRLEDMARVDSEGITEEKVRAPRQIFFVPNPKLAQSSDEHDVRLDFLKIPVGTSIYKIYALADTPKGFDYEQYSDVDIAKFVAKSELVGEIISTSKFLASEFGDEGIFFRHEVSPKK